MPKSLENLGKQDKAVLDASTIVALVVPEEYSEWAEKKVEEYSELYILDLTPYEVYNALWKKRILEELNDRELKEAVETVEDFLKICFKTSLKPLRVDALKIALKYKITVYDSAYIALTKAIKGAFITIDRKLYNKLKNTQLKNIITTPWLQP